MPGFAVLLVNYRSADLVSRCLEACAGDLPDEVVIVDNASCDDSAELLRERHPFARIVERERNDGFAAGVNTGFAASVAPVVVVLNPDTEPRPGALPKLVAQLARDERLGVVAPRLSHEDGSVQQSAFRRFPGLGMLFIDLCLPAGWLAMRFPRLDPYRVPPASLRDGSRVAHVIGAALAVRRSAFEAAGPLDEGFFLYLEETEWQRRVTDAGYEIAVVPSAEVIHLVRGGGTQALAPSPHFLASMRRYLTLRGIPRRVTDTAITVALLLSRLAARAEGLVIASERRTGGARAAAYDQLWRDRHGVAERLG